MAYFHRDLEHQLVKALEQFPAVLVTGPRQAGKSTLLRHTLKHYRYVSLDDPIERAEARQDPKLFLSLRPAPLIIDEIQYAPELFSYLKLAIDADRHRYGQYVLTGSQTFQLMEGVSESLAGRVAIFELFPLSWGEIEQIPKQAGRRYDDRAVVDQIVRGFYPEFFRTPNLSWETWYSSYLATYLERDLRNLKAIHNLDLFQSFMGLAATRAGGLLNLAEIGKECGVSATTAREWLSLLQATYVVHLLRPYYRNHSKRLVKAPKLYFVDTGLLCHLLGIDTADRLLKSAARGHIFENMVVMEIVKGLGRSKQRQQLYFYRTHKGHEVDLLYESAERLEAYEIKFSKTVTSGMASSLVHFKHDHPEATCKLLSLAEEERPLAPGISAIHWSEVPILRF